MARRLVDGGAPRRRTITSRAAVLGLVVSLVALLLALPLRTYLSQHAQIAQTEQDQAAQRHRIALLQQQVARDNDPAVIEQQARQRLQLSMPGDKTYVVIPPRATKPPAPPKDRATAVVPAAQTSGTWFGALWSSAQLAGAAVPRR